MRFEFGANWQRFLRELNAEKIESARKSLCEWLNVSDLAGKSFLDVGSGSGLFSLAARTLGAIVCSFDADPDSVRCTAELRQRFFAGDGGWQVRQGSVLDREFLKDLGIFDIVYSWGVLHHTGAMNQALENVAALVSPGGLLFLAIYNDQGRASRMWSWVKRSYNRLPRGLRWTIVLPAFVRLWGPTLILDLLSGRPGASWRSYAAGGRGMSPWRDVIDWVGGYPFEVARPEQIFDFYRVRGYELQRLKTCGGGLGCNEFLFLRKGDPSR